MNEINEKTSGINLSPNIADLVQVIKEKIYEEPLKHTRIVKLEDLADEDLYEKETDSKGVPILKRIEKYPDLPDDVFVPIEYTLACGDNISNRFWINKKGEILIKEKKVKYPKFIKTIKERLIKPENMTLNNHGYCRISLNNKNVHLHQVVSNTFLINPNPVIYKVVNHIDHDKSNNKLNNLEFVTNARNSNKMHGISSFIDEKYLINYVAIDKNGKEVSNRLNIRNTGKNKISSIIRSIKNNKKVYGYKWKKIYPETRKSREEFLKLLGFTKKEDYVWEKHYLYPDLLVCKEGFIIGLRGNVLGSINSEGYIEINSSLFPNGVKAHRILMEHKLKRKLESWEIVDHINTIRHDNCLDNLRLTDCSGNNNNPLTLEKQRKDYILLDSYGNIKFYGNKVEILQYLKDDGIIRVNISSNTGYLYPIIEYKYLLIRDIYSESIFEDLRKIYSSKVICVVKDNKLLESTFCGTRVLSKKYNVIRLNICNSIKTNSIQKGYLFKKGDNALEELIKSGNLNILNSDVKSLKSLFKNSQILNNDN